MEWLQSRPNNNWDFYPQFWSRAQWERRRTPLLKGKLSSIVTNSESLWQLIETENGCSMTDFIFNNNIKIYKKIIKQHKSVQFQWKGKN